MSLFQKKAGKQFAKVPRFTSVDFYLPPGAAIPSHIDIRGNAVQLITTIDFNRLTVPAINGTDTENCQCQWPQSGLVVGAQLPNGTLNGAGTIASFAASANSLTFTTLVTLPAGYLTLPGFVVTGTTQPSGVAAVCTVAAGVQVLFPGGAAGAYSLGLPAFTGTVAPAAPGDATFNGDGANLAVALTGSGFVTSVCASTWTQPGGVGTFPAVPICGYVHLNRLNPNVALTSVGGSSWQTIQAIPVPISPAVIRIEQEFDWLEIVPLTRGGVTYLCAGILIVEHEQDQVSEWTP